MIRFQRESLLDCASELGPMWFEHYQEAAAREPETPPFDPDWERYLALEMAGALVILTAREEDGNLVGYLMAILSPHLHFKGTLFAGVDVYWLRPSHRGGRTALRMIRAAEDLFREAGARMVTQHSWHTMDQTRLLEHAGYKSVEYVMTKVL